MKRIILAALLALARVYGVEIPPGGTDIAGASVMSASANAKKGRVESLSIGKRITMTEPAPYAAQFTLPGLGPLAKEERVLVIVKARTVSEEGMGTVTAKLQQSTAPYTSFAASTEIEVPRVWAELPVTFTVSEDVAAGQAAIVLLCGHKPQSIEVETIRAFKYPAGTSTASFPRIPRSYPGREPDAPWRKAALERIERERKAELSLRLTKDDGSPMADVEVKLTLRRHEFGFGSAVTAKRLGEEGEDAARYRDIVDRLFSIVVFENDLKDGNWDPGFTAERKAARNGELEKAFGWLAARHIPVRGHYLMQVATPFNLHGITDPAVIRERTLASVRERLSFVGDRVCEWDVINHPIAWNGADMLNKRAGLEHLDREVFQLARSVTKLPFFINEDQVFRAGPQHDDTFTYIQELNAAGLTVAGLGNQAHFHESYLPSPEHLLAVTDRFAQIVPRQAITEYDIVTTDDEQLAADYTRDVLISVFSHPAYSSFLFWGFWEGSHWKPEAASWDLDWTIRKRGEVIEEWIGKKWRTGLTLKTDTAGHIQWRGFPGWYEVTLGGKTAMVELTKAKPAGTAKF